MSEHDERGTSADRDNQADREDEVDWRRQAGFLGAAFAIAAAVIAAGLRFAPQVSAYSGLSPWVISGLLGFVLVLAGACVLFSASLPSSPAPRPHAQTPTPQPPAAPQAFPDGSFPEGSFPGGSSPDGSVPYRPAPGAQASAGPASGVPAAGAGSVAGRPPGSGVETSPGRARTMLGALLGTVGLALAAIAVALAALLPAPTESIMVQFTDLVGRVQLEYCPDLPGSFPGTASHADLVGSDTILPVKVSAETCGNPDYTDGVWIYLNRASITISDRP
ncbi:hypothetical protein [Cryobacterium sp. AP23]